MTRWRASKILLTYSTVKWSLESILLRHLIIPLIKLLMRWVLLKTTWVILEAIIRILHLLIIRHLRILILALVGLLLRIVHRTILAIHERVLSETTPLNTWWAEHARRCTILAVHVRHLSLLVRSAICRTLPNEILRYTLENIAWCWISDSAIFALFS